MNPQAILHQIRNISTQQMVVAGAVAAEVIGFFTVGEMLGRMKIVGYRGDKAEHH
jgi:F-type H+-transporting ATPase subunit g